MAQWVKIIKPIKALQRDLVPGNIVEMEDWMAEMYVDNDIAVWSTYEEAEKYYRRRELLLQGVDPADLPEDLKTDTKTADDDEEEDK